MTNCSAFWVVGYICRGACWLALCIICQSASSVAFALQPAFITGTVYDTYSRTTVSGATVSTTNGLSTIAAAGTFALRLPPDRYDIVVTCRGYRSNCLAGVLAAPGQTTSIAIWLTPVSTEFGILEGRICSHNSGEAIVNALIATDLGGFAVTNQEGFFKMLSPAGPAMLTIAATGFASKTLNNFEVLPAKTVFLMDYLRSASKERFPVSGVVTDACTGERIFNSCIASMSGDVDLNADGYFSLDIPSGFTTLIATAEDYQFAYQNLTLLSLPQITNVSLSLVPSQRGSGLLTGHILDALTGTSIAKARIQSDTGAVVFSRADGSYRLHTSLCTASLDISLDGYADLHMPVSFAGAANATIDMRLSPLVSITGQIFDASDNHTISGATLYISEQPEISAVSHTDGGYSLANIKPGSSTVNAAHRCYRSCKHVVDAVAGQHFILDVTLSPYASGGIRGMVIDKFMQTPISGATVATDNGARAHTDAQGCFELKVPVCETVLNVTADGYLPQTIAAMQISDDEELQINVELIRCPFFQLFDMTAVQNSFLITSLRSYRDIIVLNSMLAGQYVLRFYRHAPEISLILMHKATLRKQGCSLLRSVAECVLNCSADHAAIDFLVDDTIAFCEEFMQAGVTPPLRRDLERFVADVSNGTIAYLFMLGLQ